MIRDDYKLTTGTVLFMLKENGITSSRQVLLRWVREGKIKAELRSRKEGMLFDVNEVKQFIEKKRGKEMVVVPKEDVIYEGEDEMPEELIEIYLKSLDDLIRKHDVKGFTYADIKKYNKDLYRKAFRFIKRQKVWKKRMENPGYQKTQEIREGRFKNLFGVKLK